MSLQASLAPTPISRLVRPALNFVDFHTVGVSGNSYFIYFLTAMTKSFRISMSKCIFLKHIFQSGALGLRIFFVNLFQSLKSRPMVISLAMRNFLLKEEVQMKVKGRQA